MASWIDAQRRRLLASVQQSLAIGGTATLAVGSLDHYAAVRVTALSLHSSYSLLTQWAQNSGTWLVSTLQAFGTASGQALELPAMGREALFTITNGSSASMLRAFVHAVPVA